MKRFLSILTVFALLILTACDEENPVEINGDADRHTLTFNGLKEEYHAPAGVKRDLPFSLNVRRLDGSAAESVEVGFEVAFGNGAITADSDKTGANGLVGGMLSLTMPQDESTIRISASAGLSTIYKTIRLHGTPLPASLEIRAPHQLINPPGKIDSIQIAAVVSDAQGVGLPNIRLTAELQPIDENTPIFGSLSGSRYSESGAASFYFYTEGEPGKALIRIYVDEEGLEQEISASHSLSVVPVDASNSVLSLSASPSKLASERPDESISAKIIALITDSLSRGVSGLRLNFATDKGTLETPHEGSLITDESGEAEITLNLTPDVDIENADALGRITVVASVEDAGLSEELIIEYEPGWEYDVNLTIETDQNFLWADGIGKSQALITARLTNRNGEPLADEEIRFTSSFLFSAVQSPVKTDSLGVARAVFDDLGVPSIDPRSGQPDSVIVSARYRNQTAQTKIMIQELNPITSLNLYTNKRELRGKSIGDSSEFRIAGYRADGSPVSEDIYVRFSAIIGRVSPSSGWIRSTRFYYIIGGIGTDTITAVAGDLTEVFIIEIPPGPPFSIDLEASAYHLSNGERAELTATLRDRNGNPAGSGWYVSFETTLGDVIESDVSDEYGIARSFLIAGAESGQAVVWAWIGGREVFFADTIRIQIVGNAPGSIEVEASPHRISPAGSGGQTASVITAVLRDLEGEFLVSPQPVIFEIINLLPPPEGAYLNDHEGIIEIPARNGVAYATLNAGTHAGLVNIAAYTFRNENRLDTLTAYTSAVVTGGPPEGIDIDVDAHGLPAGGDAWELELAARVWDAYGNPVRDGIPVTFERVRHIAIAPALTGNRNRRGEFISGTAYTRLIYNSELSFQQIELTAHVSTPAGDIQRSRDFILPLQHGNLALHVDPANFRFDRRNEEAIIRVWCILRDGHGSLINNAPILFSSDRGEFYWRDIRHGELFRFFPDPARKFTGAVDHRNDEPPGQATVFIVCEANDIFPDPFNLGWLVQIDAEVEGYEAAAEPAFVCFTR